MRRLVVSVLLALGLLTATQTAAVAKSPSVLTFTVTERPSDLFPDTCRTTFSWTVKDPSKVATYYFDAPVNSVPPPEPLPQPKNKETDLSYFQAPTGMIEADIPPGSVVYLRVLVEYVNGTFAPWQEEIITVQPC